MKKHFLSFRQPSLWKSVSLCAIVFSILSTSCKKSSDTSSTTVTEDDAVEIVARSVDPSTGGLADQVNNNIAIIQNYSGYCGLQKDSTISHSASSTLVSYSYALHWGWMLTCSSLSVPQRFDFAFTGKSSYDAVRMSSNDSSIATATVTGLEPTSSQYTFNQSYTRKGSQVSKIRNQNSFTSTATLTSTDIKVDKGTKKIASGTASINITGASTSGNSFSYNGSITFLGNNTATVLLNSGTSYTIQW